MLDRLPLSLQQHLLLEWLSPESVWILVRVSGAARRCVLKDVPSSSAFRAANREVLSDACVRWFHERGVPLRLWSVVKKCPSLLLSYPRDGLDYFTNGKLHREDDLPAVVRSDGGQGWYQNGECHRDGDKPAMIYPNKSQHWYQHDKLHRDGDMPTVILTGGRQEWFKYGKRHRDGDLPALVWADGAQEWWQHDLLHRDDDLPAYIGADGTMRWYRHGCLYLPRSKKTEDQM